MHFFPRAVSYYPKHKSGYWAKVAKMVGARSAEECQSQHTPQGTSHTPAKKDKKPRKEKVEAPKDPGREMSLFGVYVVQPFVGKGDKLAV